MAKARQLPERQGLVRTCHVCGKSMDIHVWYARAEEEHKRRHDVRHRVYADPVCYFSLKDHERKDYYRERV
ncbi:MAG: hypothetical protein ACRDH5_11485 [bacterium]